MADVHAVLFTASTGIPNVELAQVEPFDLRALRRYRPELVAGWIAAAVAAILWLPQLQQSNGGALSDIVAKSSEALKTEARSARLFGVPFHFGSPGDPDIDQPR